MRKGGAMAKPGPNYERIIRNAIVCWITWVK